MRVLLDPDLDVDHADGRASSALKLRRTRITREVRRSGLSQQLHAALARSACARPARRSHASTARPTPNIVAVSGSGTAVTAVSVAELGNSQQIGLTVTSKTLRSVAVEIRW